MNVAVCTRLCVMAMLGFGADDPLWPGSQLTNEDASKMAQIVVVAKIVYPGDGPVAASGGGLYNRVRIQPIRFLKGQMEGKKLTVDHMKIEIFGRGIKESVPKNSDECLCFIETYSANVLTMIGVKMIRADKVNVNNVTGVIRNETRLIGSDLSVHTATKRANTVVLGTLLELGTAQPGSGATVVHRGSRVRIKRVLHGTSDSTIKMDIRRVAAPVELAEKAPTVGNDYVLFGESQKDGEARWFKWLTTNDAAFLKLSQYIAVKNYDK